MSDKSDATKKEASTAMQSRYKEEYCEGIVEFFITYKKSKEVIENKYNKDGAIIGETVITKPLTPPTFYAYAREIDVCRDTLHEWSQRYPKFAAAYKKAKGIQAQHIVENSMEGVAPTAFSIFMMKNNHGWTDKIESKIESTVTTLEGLVGESHNNEDKE